MAAASIANIVKSSLGPVGLDKMLVDDIGVSNLQIPRAKIFDLILLLHTNNLSKLSYLTIVSFS